MAYARLLTDEMKILLVGKTGAGKSATGNSILGKETFHVSGMGDSVTDAIKVSYSEIDGLQIKVVDGPGVEDTKLDDLQDKARLIKNVGKALFECNGFINAVVLVLKYGDRFTRETKSAVDAVMSTIGSNMMKDFGIVVLTYANDWNREFKKKINFQDWCRNTNEIYGGIFQKCEYRCILFENRTEVEEEMIAQQQELLEVVKNIKLSHGTYSNAHFERAAAERDKYITEKKCHLLKEEYQSKINLLTGEMMAINDSMSEGDKSRKYNDIIKKAKDLLGQAEKDDAGTGELAKLQKQLNRTIDAARGCNRESLDKLASKLEKLRQNRKGLIGWAILQFLMTICTFGHKYEDFVNAVRECIKNDEEIDKASVEISESRGKKNK